MAAGLATMSDGARTGFRVAGVVLAVTGILLLVTMVVQMGRAASADFTYGPDGIGRSGPGFLAIALPGFLGMGCLTAGAFCLKLGFLRLGAEIVATEATPAMGHTAHVWGKGLATGISASGVPLAGASQGVAVRVRCPSCRALDSEDTKFCSHCGKPM